MRINKLDINSQNGFLKRYLSNRAGFTLAELMVAALILVTILVGLLASYVTCFDLNETNRNTTLALNEAQEQLAAIRNASFSDACTNFNGSGFTVDGMPAGESWGVIYAYVDDEYNGCSGAACICTYDYDLLRIVISVSWRQKSGRVIGEDTNLDGVLDAGEDKNNNEQLDSPVQLVTFLTATE